MKPPPDHGTPLHAAILFAMLLVAPNTLGWPWHMALPLACYGALVAGVPLLRRTAPRLSLGRMTGLPLMAAALLTAGTVATLCAFDFFAQPDVVAISNAMPHAMLGSMCLAWFVVSVANALFEELIFRGVLYEGLRAEWGETIAILSTSSLFGLAHLHGYPPSVLGAVLAGGWGMLLALLRMWTGGLGLAALCHIAADATIFYLVVWSRGEGSS